MGRLAPGLLFSWAWTCGGEPSGNIRIRTEHDRVILLYKARSYGSDWKPIEQAVPIIWTECRYGGRRPWFRCSVYSNGRYCGRRVAKLYAAGELFACRHCYNLVYASQQEVPYSRGVSQAQKIRRRVGGSECLDEPFPPKPKGMHWKTYHRLESRAERAEMSADLQMAMWLSRRYLGLKG